MQPFSIMLGLGTLTGMLLILWKAPKKETSRYIDAALATLLLALLISRIGYVALNYPYYRLHPGEIIQVWKGGLSGIAALAGGFLAIIMIARWLKVSPGTLADFFLPLMGTLAITAWLGCWTDSCGYGLPSKAWWALPARDEWGVLAYRVPVQLIGAVSTLLIIGLLDRASKRITVPGVSAATGVFLIALVVFCLSFLRADATPTLQGLRLEAWGALGLMVICILTVVVLLFHHKKQLTQPSP
jgi:phosphatidylglycerol:prolipoprotein diacylglycerol transferase